LSVFFFSSRSRHTRFSRDWSSDVCSSDLSSCGEGGGDGDGQGAHEESPGFSGGADRSSRIRNATRPPTRVSHPTGPREPAPAPSIPRRTRPARYEPSPVVGSPVGRLPPSALV